MLRFIYTFLCLGLIALLGMSNVGGRAKSGGEGNTGAPGDKNYTCSNCHGGGSYNVTTQIELKDEEGNVVTRYQAARTYKLTFSFTTVSGSNPKGYGFQLVSLIDADNKNAGTMANPSADAQITSHNSRSYFEHKKSSASSSFTVDWTAPPGGTGSVTFYGVGNANNTNLGITGDVIRPATPLTIQEETASGDEISVSRLFVFPNPVSDQLRWNTLPGQEPASYHIICSDGSKIRVAPEDASKSTVSVSDLSPGMYILRAVSSDDRVIASNAFIKI